MSKFYVSTAIAYTNAKPHLGHLLEFILADVQARYHRLKGDDTYFLTGTDEHGVKIYKSAQANNMDCQQFVDMHANEFLDLLKAFNITNDSFIRTTDQLHKDGVLKLWQKLESVGDFYNNEYKALYCSGCEAFILEKDLVDKKCSVHLVEPELVCEENIFFKLSKYSKKIESLIETGELRIYPNARRNEILNLVKEGLTDVSFSRPKSVLPWGIPVPNNDEQVMYVWCDALTNYISALGYGSTDESLMKYWPCDMHIIGKDILRFHACIWIAMLLSAEIALPKSIGVHGFITSNKQKMSKSLGNVIDPMELLSKYSADAVRFFMCREIPTTDDGDFSYERFEVVYSSDLVNNFGNLASRVVAMLHKYCDGVVPSFSNFEFKDQLQTVFQNYCDEIECFNSKKAVEYVLEFATLLNQYVEDTKPWILSKDPKNSEYLHQVMSDLVQGVMCVGLLLTPFIPVATDKLAKVFGLDFNNFSLLFEREKLIGQKLSPLDPLFVRL